MSVKMSMGGEGDGSEAEAEVGVRVDEADGDVRLPVSERMLAMCPCDTLLRKANGASMPYGEDTNEMLSPSWSALDES